jgi:hypothetical protein
MKNLRKRKLVIAIFSLFISMYLWNCKTRERVFTNQKTQISTYNLSNHVKVIANDSMQGRYSGSKGQLQTAQYIADYFKSIDVKPYEKNNSSHSNLYFDDFNFFLYENFNVSITQNDKKYDNFDQILLLQEGYKEHKELPLVYIKSIASTKKVKDIDKKIVLLYATDEYVDQFEALKDLGANTVFLLTKDAKFYSKQLGKYRMKNLMRQLSISNGTSQPETGNFTPFLIAPDLSNQLLQNINDTVTVNSVPFQKISTQNVVGYINGESPDAPALVISAHYDHEGVDDSGQIFNGADDNASGVAVVLETARLFASRGKKPYRDIIFSLFSGEEQGLQGSKHFVNTVEDPKRSFFANINIDMIGRRDDTQPEDIDYIYAITDTLNFSHLRSKIDRNNTLNELELKVDYSYADNTHSPDSINTSNIIRRSDHWHFMKNDIPSVGFFSGFHKDYHKTTDTSDKIDISLLKNRAQLIFNIALELSNKDVLSTNLK